MRTWSPIYFNVIFKLFLQLQANTFKMMSKFEFMDVRAKNFYNTDFFIFLQQSDNELPLSEMQDNWGGGFTDFVFEIKRMGSYPNFDRSLLVTGHGLSGCWLKNIKNDSL